MTKEKLLMQLKNAPGYQVCYANIEGIVNNEFVKNLRRKLDMSQSVFAAVLGVTKKTIEKWEQGVNPIKGCSARLLYLIYNNESIIRDLYNVNRVNIESKEVEYIITSKKNNNAKTNLLDVQLNDLFESKSEYQINSFENQFNENLECC